MILINLLCHSGYWHMKIVLSKLLLLSLLKVWMVLMMLLALGVLLLVIASALEVCKTVMRLALLLIMLLLAVVVECWCAFKTACCTPHPNTLGVELTLSHYLLAKGRYIPYLGHLNASVSSRGHRIGFLPIHPHPSDQNIAILSISIHRQILEVMRRHHVSLRSEEEGA